MDDPLKFVKYSVNASSLPVDLAVPEEIDHLVYAEVPLTYNFEKEQRVVAKYEADEKAKASGPQRNPPIPAAAAASSTDAKAGAGSSGAAGSTPGRNPWYEEQIVSMMKETGQNKQTCEFYLESQDWDMEKAINSFRNA
jgi:hypothetical protein